MRHGNRASGQVNHQKPEGRRKIIRTSSRRWLERLLVHFTRQDLWTPQRPFEIDVLLMHEKYGFLAMEVKGGPVRIEKGEWYRGTEHFKNPPIRQAQDAAYELRDHLRDHSVPLQQVQIPHALVLPDVLKLEGQLPPSCKKEMLFLNPVFENIENMVTDCIIKSEKRQYLSSKKIEEFYRVALPTVNFVWDPDAQRRYSNDAITRISDEQIRALRSLDINDRVLVSGVAGSGKTRLALMWAHQTARSGRNTLLSCYNDPLGRYLQSVSSPYPTLTVGPFLRTVSQFPGIPRLEEPIELADRDNFWNIEMIEHLYEYAEQSEINLTPSSWTSAKISMMNGWTSLRNYLLTKTQRFCALQTRTKISMNVDFSCQKVALLGHSRNYD